MLKDWQRGILGFFIVFGIVFVGSFLFPAAYPICNDECIQYHLGPFIFFRSVALADQHNGLIAAVAGVFVAIFTWTLYRTSGRQADLTDETLGLATSEFNATHRPRIKIRNLWLQGAITPEKPILVDIVAVNVGDAKAVIHSFGCDFNIIKPKGFLPANMTPKGRKPDTSLIWGLGETQRISGVSNDAPFPNSQWLRVVNREANLYCFGYVEYTGEGSEKIIRRTAFCRVYREAQSGEGSGRFFQLEENDPDYEYED